MTKKQQSKKDFLAHYPTVEEIIRDYLSGLGRKGGSAKSEKKAKASRENGKRPKKKRKS